MKKLISILFLIPCLSVFGQGLNPSHFSTSLLTNTTGAGWYSALGSPTSLTATNLTGNISPQIGTYSNAVPDWSKLFISDCPLPYVNGEYDLLWTNSGTAQAVWRHVGSLTNIIFQNDTGNTFGGLNAVEPGTNDANFFYFGPDGLGTSITNPTWTPNDSRTELLGTSCNICTGTNYVLSSHYVILGTTNTFSIPNSGSTSNVVWVNPVTGNDTNIFTFGAPIQTIRNACASPFISYGGVMNIAPGIDPETSPMNIPAGVIVNAWGTILTGPGGEQGDSVGDTLFNASQNDTINGLTMTNGNIYTQVSGFSPNLQAYPTNVTLNHCSCFSGIDGIVLWNIGQGFKDLYGHYESHWDNYYIGGSTTNATVELTGCYMKAYAPSFGGAANTTGMHNIALFGFAGSLYLHGGTYICIGATNKAASAPNACIGIMLSSNTMSIHLDGPTFIYGSTNAGVVVSPFSYAAGASPINITGDYYAITNNTGDLSETNMTVTHVFLSPITVASINNATNGTPVTTGSVNRWETHTNNGTLYYVPLYK